MKNNIHSNSYAAYMQERQNLSKRSTAILEHLQLSKEKTDRQVRDEMGFDDMNNVRPRITELVQAGFLTECGKTKCPITNKLVRLVKFYRPKRADKQALITL